MSRPAVAPVRLEVIELDVSGDGVAIHEGRPLRIPATIPGEMVEAIPRARGAAQLVAVTRPSPHRVIPRCRHFGPCGGCTWQHIAYGEQLRLKQHLLQRLLVGALGGRAPHVMPVIGTPSSEPDGMPWAYRHKVHFVFGPARAARPAEGGPDENAGGRVPSGGRRAPSADLVMGHFGRGSRHIVPVVECPVHADAGNRLAFAVRDDLRAARVSGTDPETTNGVARHIVVRVGRYTGERVATLVVTRDDVRALRTVTRRIAEDEAPDGWNLNVHAGPSPYLFGRSTRHLFGRERLREQIAGVSFLISPTAFFQTNVDAAARLVDVVLAQLHDLPNARLLDLYAGAGLFALPLAASGRRLVAIEENQAAVADGRASQHFSRIDDGACRFVAGRVEKTLDGLARGRGGLGRFAGAVLDPPRQGCAPDVLRLLAAGGVPRLVYVSCDPVSLARDLRILLDAGYRAMSTQPVDMFPHTAHVESVTSLMSNL